MKVSDRQITSLNSKVNNNIAANMRKLVGNPFGQFMLLGIVLLIVNTLAQSGILPKSLSVSVASTVIYAIIAIGFCLLLGYSGLASL